MSVQPNPPKSEFDPVPVKRGDKITFSSNAGISTGIVANVRVGLVWHDFVLEDGRVIPEHRVLERPEAPPWRDPDTVSAAERKEWERRLIANADAEIAAVKDEAFWADLLQYAVYTYLRFARISGERPSSKAEELAHGQKVFNLLQSPAHPTDPRNYGLTGRELQIIYDVADGYSDNKVGVTTRLELALFAINHLPWLRSHH